MSTIKICALSLGIAVVLFVSSCKSEVDQSAWSSHQEVVDQFYSKPVKERVATFRRIFLRSAIRNLPLWQSSTASSSALSH